MHSALCKMLPIPAGLGLPLMLTSVAALGMLGTIAIGLATDAYGPVSDSAGGIAEMVGMRHRIWERTDALDVAGNTTAAIGKGFAIGSAALVSLVLFGAFVSRTAISTVNVLTPKVFIGLNVGAMLPYWYSAMTMKSVGSSALKMVEEVRRKFKYHSRSHGGHCKTRLCNLCQDLYQCFNQGNDPSWCSCHAYPSHR